MGAPPRWEQIQGWGGLTGSSLRSTHPRLPAAVCKGGAPPETAALGAIEGKIGEVKETQGREEEKEGLKKFDGETVVIGKKECKSGKRCEMRGTSGEMVHWRESK